MTALLIVFIWAVNFSISWWNAYYCGKSWADSKLTGGFPRLLVWCGAIMSASGFTWCYGILLAFIGQWIGKLTPEQVEGLLNATYLFVIIPIIGSGLIIWLNSVYVAYKRRSLLNIGVAGWNTFAQIYNLVSAFKNVPQAFSFLTKLKSTDKKGYGLIILLGIFALIGGMLTTMVIIRKTAKSTVQDIYAEHRAQQKAYER
jgi:hypothetical protein